MDDPEITRDELRQRLTYSLLAPAVRLARRAETPLKDAGALLELAYFQAVRRQGLPLRDVARALGVSMRKAADLSQRVKQNFFAPEREAELPRRIEFALWAEDLSEARVRQLFSSEEPDALRAALDQLVDEERVAKEQRQRSSGVTYDIYSAKSRTSRLVKPAWGARVDGLNWLLRAVGGAVIARFVDNDEERTLARVVTLRVRPEDLPKLFALYQQQIWPSLLALDEDAQDSDDALAMDVAFTFTPLDTDGETS